MLFFLTYIHQKILKNKINQFPQKYKTVFITNNNYKCLLIIRSSY